MISQLGRPEDGTDPTLPQTISRSSSSSSPSSSGARRRKTLTALVTEMDANLKEIPGLEYNFSQPIRDNVNENISGQFGQIAVKIYGDDLATLQQLAENAKAAIATVPGAADLGIVKSGRCPSWA